METKRLMRTILQCGITLLAIVMATPSAFAFNKVTDPDQLKIYYAYGYLPQNSIFIEGANFKKKNKAVPVVTFGDKKLVIYDSYTDTQIQAILPSGFPAGSYLLTVYTGDGEKDYAECTLTVGAVGPQGPIGLTGAVGPQGPKGDTGATGTPYIPSLSSSMVHIPAGSFQMGDGIDNMTSAMPLHTVTLSAFYLEKYEVTKALWAEVYTWAIARGYSFEHIGTDTMSEYPEPTVTWYDVIKWLNARSEKEGRIPVYYTDNGQATVYKTGQVNVAAAAVKWTANGYRLPTEAEWEYAARAGTTTRYYTGNCISSDTQANYSGLAAYNGCPTGQRRSVTTVVGSFPTNPWGLYDILGNVWEWTWDWYGPYTSNAVTDPRGPDSGSTRVIRGGGWGSDAYQPRLAYRHSWLPSLKATDIASDLGFRCAISQQ